MKPSAEELAFNQIFSFFTMKLRKLKENRPKDGKDEKELYFELRQEVNNVITKVVLELKSCVRKRLVKDELIFIFGSLEKYDAAVKSAQNITTLKIPFLDATQIHAIVLEMLNLPAIFGEIDSVKLIKARFERLLYKKMEEKVPVFKLPLEVEKIKVEKFDDQDCYKF